MNDMNSGEMVGISVESHTLISVALAGATTMVVALGGGPPHHNVNI